VADFCSYGPSCNKLRGCSQNHEKQRCFEEAHCTPLEISRSLHLVVTNNILHYKHFLPVTELASSERVETSVFIAVLSVSFHSGLEIEVSAFCLIAYYGYIACIYI
jgi:hypothetical protein